MRVVVTGANGFVGKHLCPRLSAAGHEVVPVESPRGSGKYRIDLRDVELVASLLADMRPEGIIHLAARALPGGPEHFGDLLEHNAGTTWALLEGVRRGGLGTRVIAVSSSAVYGPVPRERNPITEDQPLRPALPYGAAKVASEAIASTYHRAGQDLVVVRPFNLAGPGQSAGFVPACFAKALVAVERGGATGIDVGHLDTWRDFLDVRDLVDGLVTLLGSSVGHGFGPFNMCSGVARSIREVLTTLMTMAGLPQTPVRERAGPPPPLDVTYQCGSLRGIQAAIPWRPAIAWEDTLRETLNDWRERRRETDA